MRPEGNGTDGPDATVGFDGVEDVLPPPRELAVDPDDRLWHTASFAAVTEEPPRRKLKLTAGMSFLGIATVAVCAYAGVELAGIAGVSPPSPPRYVIDQQADARQGEAQHLEQAPPPLPAAAPVPPAAGAGPPAPGRSAATRAMRGHDGDKAEKPDKSDKSDKSDKAERRKRKSRSDDD